jgi:hypothetical protein
MSVVVSLISKYAGPVSGDVHNTSHMDVSFYICTVFQKNISLAVVLLVIVKPSKMADGSFMRFI